MPETQVREHGLLLNGAMVRAVLEGRKTQTRRPVKFPQWFNCCESPKRNIVPHNGDEAAFGGPCYLRIDYCENCGSVGDRLRPAWNVGDVLWVRETWRYYGRDRGDGFEGGIEYRADGSHRVFTDFDDPESLYDEATAAFASAKANRCNNWRPNIHIPRDLSRINLEVTRVRVQRVQDISEEDAIAEGLIEWTDPPRVKSKHYGVSRADCWETKASSAFARIWDSIYGKSYPWSENPLVWAIDFRRVT